MRSDWKGRNPGLAWSQNSLLSMFNFHGNLNWCLALTLSFHVGSQYQATGRKSLEYDYKLTGNIPSALSLSPFEDYLCHLWWWHLVHFCEGLLLENIWASANCKLQAGRLQEQVSQITDLELRPSDSLASDFFENIFCWMVWIFLQQARVYSFHPWLNDAWCLPQIWVWNWRKKRPLKRI